MKKVCVFIVIVMVLSTLTACAPGTSIQIDTTDSTIQLTMPGPNPMVNQPDTQGRMAGALAGLWHGAIVPITLVLSFFNSDVQIYEVHNAGAEYNFGFILGELFVFALISLFLRIRRSAQ